ncbi:TetR/AcrR family transcriptional regulator, partial [Bacteroidales bacterium MSK.15.36]|nr:TetR/AcrR family transcriptional regulator [Bacteroidales bacterium MSK.15.36]
MSDTGFNKRKIQAMETKNKIYNIAIDLIGKYGYDNVSIDEICNKAEVSKGTFYHHFNAKEDVIIALYKDEYECFINNIKKSTIDNSIEKLVELICFHVKYAEKKGLDIMKQVYKSQLDYGDKLAFSKNVLLQEMLCEIISKGQLNNEIRKDMQCKDIIDYLIRLSHGII